MDESNLSYAISRALKIADAQRIENPDSDPVRLLLLAIGEHDGTFALILQELNVDVRALMDDIRADMEQNTNRYPLLPIVSLGQEFRKKTKLPLLLTAHLFTIMVEQGSELQLQDIFNRHGLTPENVRSSVLSLLKRDYDFYFKRGQMILQKKQGVDFEVANRNPENDGEKV